MICSYDTYFGASKWYLFWLSNRCYKFLCSNMMNVPKGFSNVLGVSRVPTVSFKVVLHYKLTTTIIYPNSFDDAYDSCQARMHIYQLIPTIEMARLQFRRTSRIKPLGEAWEGFYDGYWVSNFKWTSLTSLHHTKHIATTTESAEDDNNQNFEVCVCFTCSYFFVNYFS
jgi:hypothetical protein